LVYLVEHRGRLVTKEQILTVLWPDSFVEEANLTVCVSALRKALGEKRGEELYISTVPKKGYRFVASVAEVERAAGSISTPIGRPVTAETGVPAVAARQAVSLPDVSVAPRPGAAPPVENLAEPEAESAPRKRLRNPRLLVIATLSLLAVIAALALLRMQRARSAAGAAKQLAVLPFQNLKHEPETDFLGFSLADAITNRLGNINQLTIRPSNAVQRYRDQSPDPREVAKALSVDTLLTGSFIREGDDLRVGYQLVDAKNNRLLRQGTVDVKYQNLLTVQDEVSAQVISALSVSLSPAESAQLKSPQFVPQVPYEYYLRGVDLYSRNEFPLAIKMLEESAELYPSYALTWAHLGRSYTAAASFNFGGAELYQKAEAAYQKALALQPDLPVARIYMANLLTDTGSPERAVPLLRETLNKNPNLAEAHWELGYAYRHGGMQQESVAECLRARELDPVVKLTSSAINAYLYLGDYDAFLRSLPAPGDAAYIEFYRGFGLYYAGRTEQALAVLERAYELDPRMLQTQVGKALAHHLRHEDEQGLVLLRAAEDLITQQGVADGEAIYKLAQAYSELGDAASAIRIFRRSVEGGFFPDEYFARDPLMENARRHDEFQQVLATAHQRSEKFRQQFS
jgi:TolB-like protein/Flp pilus assembly protein TadD